MVPMLGSAGSRLTKPSARSSAGGAGGSVGGVGLTVSSPWDLVAQCIWDISFLVSGRRQEG